MLLDKVALSRLFEMLIGITKNRENTIAWPVENYFLTHPPNTIRELDGPVSMHLPINRAWEKWWIARTAWLARNPSAPNVVATWGMSLTTAQLPQVCAIV